MATNNSNSPFLSVAQAYLNQHKIDAEVRKLQTNVNQFSKQTAQWLSLMEGLNNSVKVGREVSKV